MSYWSKYDPENFDRELEQRRIEHEKRMEMEWEWYETEQANLLLCTPVDDTTFIVEDGTYLIGKPEKD